MAPNQQIPLGSRSDSLKRAHKISKRLKLLASSIAVLTLTAVIPASTVGADDEPVIPKSTLATDGNVLRARAVVSMDNRDNLKAWKASKLYQQGASALDAKNLELAAECFKMAAPGFDQPGYEKFEAQSMFAEAQSRRLLGQTKEAALLYQAAIDLFKEYDPLSPYLKAALDNLAKVDPAQKGRVEVDKARLRALTIPNRIMTVDRNIGLRGPSDYSSKLLAQKDIVDLPADYVNGVIHKAFVKMTCLETAELGSNYITAEGNWYPLISNGKSVAIVVSPAPSELVPIISVKINERFYNLGVDLPGLGRKRTVVLLTDGAHIIAIDPETEDMWNLDAEFRTELRFSWRKLLHFKPRPRITTTP